MIKHINTGVSELIAVKVPEDKMHIMEQYPHGYFYMHYGAPTMDRSNTVYLAYKHGGATHYLAKIGIEKDFQSEYISLGIAHELTEEVWDSVLPEARRLYFDTPSISGLSLLEVNEVYAVNPYGDKEPEDIEHLGAFTQMMRHKHREWKKCQENVGKWVLLKKIE